MAAVGSSPNDNGATISSTTLNLEPFDATHPGVVTTGAQTKAGVLTLSSAPVLSALTASKPVFTDGSKALTSSGTVGMANGGLGVTTLTNHGVLIGQGSSSPVALGAGSAGQILQSGGASADPAYSTPTYPSASGTSGKILRSDGTNNVYSGFTIPDSGTSGGVPYYSSTSAISSSGALTQYAVVLGGGAGAAPNSVSGVGTSGQILTSNGAGANPSWQDASGGTATSPTKQNFAATPTQAGWMFTITSGNATVGSTWTNNGNTYTAIATVASATQVWMSGTGATSGGTLTKATGSGDATLTFSTKVAYGTYTTPANVKWLSITMIGGGGGGAGSATLLANAGLGGAGGLSAFGAGTLIATGGAGGGVTANTGSVGGTCSTGPTGFVSYAGGTGEPPANNSGNMIKGSGGGGTPIGQGGFPGGVQGGSAPTVAANTGVGGGSPGQSNNPTLTGGGGAGGGYCEAIITSPAATYAVIIGSAGTAGSNGSGGAGSSTAGSTGYLSIEEHYNY